jgi:para-nitrobenzyl esterase
MARATAKAGRGALLAGVLALIPGPALAEPAASEGAVSVRTAAGVIIGRLVAGVNVFRKVPFAAPPVGPLRFRPPQPVRSWAKPLHAEGQVPDCIQFGRFPSTLQSEDCLYLNVFVPATAKPGARLPVMAWIFGGGLTVNGINNFDGSALAREGQVIVVTINYRLGVLGMLADHRLDEPGALSGNYLVRDQQAGLRWIRQNIAGFGGDPRLITLFGQSSGASSVLMQLSSPAARGLFQRAIVESSGGGYLYGRKVVEQGASRMVIEGVGCADKADVISCLRSVPAAAFTAVQVPMSSSGEDAAKALGLVQDPALLPMSPLDAINSGRFNRVPVMTGTNSDEGGAWVGGLARELGHRLTAAELEQVARERFFGASTAQMLAHYPFNSGRAVDDVLMDAVTDYRQSCPTDAVRLALSRWTPTFGFEFAQREPVGPDAMRWDALPHHSSEVKYLFLDSRRPPLTGDHAAVGLSMRQAWATFARTGKPLWPGVRWPQFKAPDVALVRISANASIDRDFAQRHQCGFLRESQIVRY